MCLYRCYVLSNIVIIVMLCVLKNHPLEDLAYCWKWLCNKKKTKKKTLPPDSNNLETP